MILLIKNCSQDHLCDSQKQIHWWLCQDHIERCSPTCVGKAGPVCTTVSVFECEKNVKTSRQFSQATWWRKLIDWLIWSKKRKTCAVGWKTQRTKSNWKLWQNFWKRQTHVHCWVLSSLEWLKTIKLFVIFSVECVDLDRWVQKILNRFTHCVIVVVAFVVLRNRKSRTNLVKVLMQPIA